MEKHCNRRKSRSRTACSGRSVDPGRNAPVPEGSANNDDDDGGGGYDDDDDDDDDNDDDDDDDDGDKEEEEEDIVLLVVLLPSKTNQDSLQTGPCNRRPVDTFPVCEVANYDNN